VVPTRTYASAQGPCREYTMDAVVGGRPENVYGTACRQADGSWRVQQ
jgi:surface antigen